MLMFSNEYKCMSIEMDSGSERVNARYNAFYLTEPLWGKEYRNMTLFRPVL